MKRQRVALFGSTGSVGRAAFDVIRRLPDRFELVALAARTSADVLVNQARASGASRIVLTDWRAYRLAAARARPPIEPGFGLDALIDTAAGPGVDILIMAMSGTMGVLPVLAALERGRRVCLATKEILVSFGENVMAAARRYRAPVLPIDSELSAIHQCIGDRTDHVRRVYVTASGGPFWRKGAPARTTLTQALKHPTWRMGRKITVDSATLMNKGLEVIETCRLFGLRPNQVHAAIHPQSVVHGLVEFDDGSTLAQLARPDMRLPIQYALTWPERVLSPVQPLDVPRLGSLEFHGVDTARFPCYRLARQALVLGPAGTCVLNAANEVAADAFIHHQLDYHGIPRVVGQVLGAWRRRSSRAGKRPGVRRLLAIEEWAAFQTRQLVDRKRRDQ